MLQRSNRLLKKVIHGLFQHAKQKAWFLLCFIFQTRYVFEKWRYIPIPHRRVMKNEFFITLLKQKYKKRVEPYLNDSIPISAFRWMSRGLKTRFSALCQASGTTRHSSCCLTGMECINAITNTRFLPTLKDRLGSMR